MNLPVQQSILRFYLIAQDRMEGRPAAEVIVDAARTLGATFALARPGIAGLGRHGDEVDLLTLETRPGRMPITVQVMAPETALLELLVNLLGRGLPDREVVIESHVRVMSLPSRRTVPAEPTNTRNLN